MNEKEIAIIIAVNNDIYLNECLYYIQNLIVPEGYEISFYEIRDAISMTEAYNEGMSSSDAKYKIYMHQDVLLTNQGIVCEIINCFENNPKLGLIGVLGGNNLPKNAICYNAWNVGNLWANNTTHTFHIQYSKEQTITGVEAIDGMFMATQYDVPWRSDILNKWDFYDVSQSLEFRRKGYEVGVLRQDVCWCIHDCGHSSLANYYNELKNILAEYTEYFDNSGEHDGEHESKEQIGLREKALEIGETYFERNLPEVKQILFETQSKVLRNTKLSYMCQIYKMRADDISKYGRWKFGAQLSYDRVLEKLQELRFMIWRIEMGHEDIYVLRDMLEKNLISMENLGMLIASITTQPKGLYEKIGFVLK